MAKKNRFGLAPAFWLLLVSFGFGTEVRAVRVERGPKIDGDLAEAVWAEAVPSAEFRTVEPLPNQNPSERTEIRVVYDDASLYIGLLCYDRAPGLIAANTMSHDASGGGSHGSMYGYAHGASAGSSDDLVRVLLDPFLDKRTAYIFTVNPLGARSEGLAYGGSSSLNWDGIWDARSRIVPDGWSAEMRIPFKTISFKPGLSVWGINVERVIPRKLETIRLSGTNRDSNFYNPMEAAGLSGILGVHQGSGFTFRPYGLASTTPGETSGGRDRDWKADGGFDLYKNFTPNLVGALSYRMDFAETEVDERRINLTRFPLYFPEKRMFFLEGSDAFSFSSDVLPYDLEVARGIVLPRGPYDYATWRFSVNTASHRPIILSAGTNFGGFYSGRLREVTLGLTAKLDGYANISVSADLVRGRLPQGTFTENVFQLKADFFLSPDLGLMNYIQYDDISRQLGLSSRLRWQISPGNEVYLVFNKNWERRLDPTARFLALEEHGVLKLSLSIRP
jgi:hypothetical protein